MPAESLRNVAVAALNPPGLPNALAHAPARYSRRGPGLRAGVKPDLAHIGGSGSPQSPLGHGLFSLKPDGSTCDGCGTSYATPIVAKTAAALDQSIEGAVSRETLIGLLVHHAEMPTLLATKALSGIARHLAGFGVPPSAREILKATTIRLLWYSRRACDRTSRLHLASLGRPRLLQRTVNAEDLRSLRWSLRRHSTCNSAPSSFALTWMPRSNRKSSTKMANLDGKVGWTLFICQASQKCQILKLSV